MLTEASPETVRLRGLLARAEPLLVSMAQDRCRWRDAEHSYCPTDDCCHNDARVLVADIRGDEGCVPTSSPPRHRWLARLCGDDRVVRLIATDGPPPDEDDVAWIQQRLGGA